jgi:hypothetical protein
MAIVDAEKYCTLQRLMNHGSPSRSFSTIRALKTVTLAYPLLFLATLAGLVVKNDT